MLDLERFDALSRRVPLVANLRPNAVEYLMEDFFYAGGICALMGNIREHLHLDCLTVTGRSIGENIADAKVYNDDVIRPLSNPIYGEGSLAVLKRWGCLALAALSVLERFCATPSEKP